MSRNAKGLPVALNIIFMKINNPKNGDINESMKVLKFFQFNLFSLLSLQYSDIEKRQRNIPNCLDKPEIIPEKIAK